VRNDEIILDPTGVVHAGGIERVPFPVTEHDRMIEAIVLSENADRLTVALETPGGEVIGPAALSGIPGASHFAGAHEVVYRIDLPFPAPGGASHGGKWALVLAKGGSDDKRPVSYAAIVNTRSEVAFRADVRQSGHFVGAEASVDAWLTQFGVPFERNARVLAHWTSPSSALSTLTLSEKEPGHYAARHVLSEVGLHRIRVTADGQTERGFVFKREATRTLYAGTSSADDPGNERLRAEGTKADCLLCRLLAWPGIRALLKRLGGDPATLDACCHDRTTELAADRERELRIPAPRRQDR
jgi:hypothetical protein